MATATSTAAAIPVRAPSARTGLAQGFLGNLTAILGGQISCALVALVVQACYARFLGPTGRGQVSVCLMVVAFGVLLGGLGADYPLTIWTAHSRENSKKWLPAVVSVGLLGSISASILWIGVYWKWSPAFLKGLTPAMAVLALASIPLSIAITFLMAALTGMEKFQVRSRLALLNQILSLCGLVVAVFVFGATPEKALLGAQVGSLICAIVMAVILRDFLSGAWSITATAQKARSVLSLGLRGQLGNLATFFNYRLDVFVVNYFFDTTQVGLYAVGVLVAEGLWQIPHAAALALIPRTARTIEDGATQFSCSILRHVVLVAAVSGVALAVLSPWAIPLVFGSRFALSVPVIWWILPGTIALSVSKVICADLAGRGRPEFSSVCAFLSLAVTVPLDFLLIPRMGINGAALASSAAYLIQTVLLAFFMKRQLRVPLKAFLIPSAEEFAAYRLVWRFCEGLLLPRPEAVLPPALK